MWWDFRRLVTDKNLLFNHRCSGASEEDQRLRLCPLHSERRRHHCHERSQREGQDTFSSTVEGRTRTVDLVFFCSAVRVKFSHLPAGGGRLSHRGDSRQAGWQGQLRSLHKRDWRTGRISAAARLHYLHSGTGRTLNTPQSLRTSFMWVMWEAY